MAASGYDGPFADPPRWISPHPPHRMPHPVPDPGCCTSGPLYSPTGFHAFVHCPEMCRTCTGTGSLHHPYLILPWDGSHGIAHREVYPEHREVERERFVDHEEEHYKHSVCDQTTTSFSEEEEENNDYHPDRETCCLVCNIKCTTPQQLQDHLRGKMHQRHIRMSTNEELAIQGTPPRRKRKRKRRSAAHSQAGERSQAEHSLRSVQSTCLSNSESRIKFQKLGGQVQSCESCSVICGSWGVLQAHFDSKRHMARLKHLSEDAKAGNQQAIARLRSLERQMEILKTHGFM